MLNYKLQTASRRSNYKFLFICLFAYLLICLFPPSATAQTYSLGIWPPLLEVMIKPGKSVTQVYQITNSGEDQSINVRILPFEPSDEKGNIALLPAPQLLRPLSLTIDGADLYTQKSYYLKSGETKNLLLKITAPPRCPEKDFYASLVLETTLEPPAGLSLSQTVAKIAGNILITVSSSGSPDKKARIVEFSAPKIVDSFDPVVFTLKVENLGTAYFKPFGKVNLEGILGQKGQVQIQPDNLLPQYVRELTVPPWKNKFILGPFKAELSFTLDEEGEKVSEKVTFLALPYKLMLSLITIGLILFTFSNLPKKGSFR